MGKKTLIKSTAKKKAESEKTDKTKKKAGTRKTKKSAAVNTKKTLPSKTVTAEKKDKAMTQKDLITKKFDSWKPETLYAPDTDKPVVADAPPFISATDEKDMKRQKELLFAKFSMEGVVPAKAAEPAKPKKAAPPKKKMTIQELLAMKFEAWAPENLFVPEAEKPAVADAPPFITAADEKEAEFQKALLFTKFSMEGVIPAVVPDPVKPKKAAPPKKKMTIPELLAMKFEAWMPEKLFVPEAEKPVAVDAPPFITATDEKKAEFQKNLLFTKFSMEGVIPAVVPDPVRTPPATPVEEAAHPAEKEAEIIKTEEPVLAKPEIETVKEQEKIPAEEVKPEPVKEEIKAEPKPQPLPEKTHIKEKDTVMAKVSYAQDEMEKKKVIPLEKNVMYAIAGFALLILILLGASFSNSCKYAMEPSKMKDAVDIYKGKFAPMGMEYLLTLPNTKLPESGKTELGKNEIFPMIFAHYIASADESLETTGNFNEVKDTLHKAVEYANNTKDKNAVLARLNLIELNLLLYKSQAATDKGSVEGYKEALEYLAKAKKLYLYDHHSAQVDALIEGKIAEVNAGLDAAVKAADAEKAEVKKAEVNAENEKAEKAEPNKEDKKEEAKEGHN